MPGLSGIGLAQRIRQEIRSKNPRFNPSIPIIMITSFGTKKCLMAARDAGVDEFLAKPFTTLAVAERIDSAINMQRSFIVSDNYIGPCRRRKVDPATLSPEARAAWEARRANNAFLKVRPLSDELCSFMGLASKSQKSQTDVTKFISGYVKSHNCFDPTFKRRILPDAKLAKLLRVTDKDEVTYLNLQSFLKVHFIKPATTA
jgi:hypothetical protein